MSMVRCGRCSRAIDSDYDLDCFVGDDVVCEVCREDDENDALQPGQRVEVKWHRHGWLPGTFVEASTTPDPGETVQRFKVKMDNGWACHGSGYHPDCVRAVQP